MPPMTVAAGADDPVSRRQAVYHVVKDHTASVILLPKTGHLAPPVEDPLCLSQILRKHELPPAPPRSAPRRVIFALTRQVELPLNDLSGGGGGTVS